MRPSGPAARELPLNPMALLTIEGEKGEADVSSGRCPMRRRLTRRVCGSEEWSETDVNCLQKAFAISLLRVRVLLLKVMGWFGGIVGRLFESDLRRAKYWEVLYLCEQDSTVLIQVCLLVLRISCVICSSSLLMSEFVGE